MIYKSCSINEVIARVIRNTRIVDSSYIEDMKEWIPEAMMAMKTQFQLKPVYMDVTIDFHKGKLPCTLESLEAVVYKGLRLQTSNGIHRPQAGSEVHATKTQFPETFISGAIQEPSLANHQGNSVVWNSVVVSTETIEKCKNIPCGGHWYQTELDWITTSICDGTIRLYYWEIPLDSDGLPLIPDNEDYKQALYYYTRAMMLGAGYEDKMFNYEQLLQHYEVHARRAMNQITYPSVDKKEAQLKMLSFNIPEAYWDNMFNNEDCSTNVSTNAYNISKGQGVKNTTNTDGNLIEDGW